MVVQARRADIRARLADASRHVARVLLAGVIAAPLAACSSTSGTMFTLFAEPGKYAFHSCPQIADQIKNWTQRQQELKSLMERADQAAAGPAVSLLAYRADYVAAGEELEQLRATAREKKCDQDGASASSTVIR